MAASSERPRSQLTIGVAVAVAAVAFFWAFPLFRMVPLERGAAVGSSSEFNPAATAAKLWSGELREAAQRAADASVVVTAIRANPAAARSKYAGSAGLGTAYYFVRGSGKVIARDRTTIRVALDGPQPAIIALRIGPIFGNAVRDGCGLLDVNKVPGLSEFNALSTELNQLVETQVLPGLLAAGNVGAVVNFAGCAEAPETVASGDEPILILVPVMAEVRG